MCNRNPQLVFWLRLFYRCLHELLLDLCEDVEMKQRVLEIIEDVESKQPHKPRENLTPRRNSAARR